MSGLELVGSDRVEQRERALAEANRRRYARAALKRQLKIDPGLMFDVLEDPPDYVLTAELEELFKALPRFGPERVGRLVNGCGMSVHKKMGSLTVRQRGLLSVELRVRLGVPEQVAA